MECIPYSKLCCKCCGNRMKAAQLLPHSFLSMEEDAGEALVFQGTKQRGLPERRRSNMSHLPVRCLQENNTQLISPLIICYM